MIVDVIPEGTRALAEWLRGRRQGSTEVHDVGFSIEGDSSGEAALFIELTLNDPLPGDAAWPIDEVIELVHQINVRVVEVLPEVERWYVRYRPVTDDTAYEDEDDEEDEDW